MLLFLKKIWKFIKKYWEAFVALLLLLIGYVAGKKGDMTKIIKKDIELKDKASKKHLSEIKELHDNHLKERDKIAKEKERKTLDIEERKKENIKNLSNNEQKLDNILSNDHGLKKGE